MTETLQDILGEMAEGYLYCQPTKHILLEAADAAAARIAELEAQLAEARSAMPEPDEVVLTASHWKLMAHDIKIVRKQERERCAKVAADFVLTGAQIGPLFVAGWSEASTRIAAAIRALPDEVK